MQRYSVRVPDVSGGVLKVGWLQSSVEHAVRPGVRRVQIEVPPGVDFRLTYNGASQVFRVGGTPVRPGLFVLTPDKMEPTPAEPGKRKRRPKPAVAGDATVQQNTEDAFDDASQ